MLKKNPLVSVILSVYNSEQYIESCIRSILNQTFKDFDLIILDNGSDKETRSVINLYQDSRIKYERNDDCITMIINMLLIVFSYVSCSSCNYEGDLYF